MLRELYLNLITSEHKTKPKYIAYVGKTLDGAVETDTMLEGVDNLFNIDTAVGDQLDKIGTLLALSRDLPINDPRVTLPLSDESYRLCLKAKIARDIWDGTIEGYYNLLQTLFPDSAWDLVDNQDMTMIFNLIQSGLTEEMEALFEFGFIVPKPSGVKLTINIQENAAFGWDSDTAFIKGWDTGIWAHN